MSTTYEVFSPGSTGTTATNPVTETEMREFFDRVTSSYATSFVAFSEQAKVLERVSAQVSNLETRLANLEADNKHFEEDNSRLQKERDEFENDIRAANDYANKIRDESAAEIAQIKAEYEARLASLREALAKAEGDHAVTIADHASTNGSVLEELAATQRVLDETRRAGDLAKAERDSAWEQADRLRDSLNSACNDRDAAVEKLDKIRDLLNPPKPSPVSEPSPASEPAGGYRPFLPLT